MKVGKNSDRYKHKAGKAQPSPPFVNGYSRTVNHREYPVLYPLPMHLLTDNITGITDQRYDVSAIGVLRTFDNVRPAIPAPNDIYPD